MHEWIKQVLEQKPRFIISKQPIEVQAHRAGQDFFFVISGIDQYEWETLPEDVRLTLLEAALMNSSHGGEIDV